MRVLVLNCPNTLNYGSMMMAENLLYYLWTACGMGEVDFLVATDKPSQSLDRLMGALPFAGLNVDTVGRVINGSRLRRLFSLATGLGFKGCLDPEVKTVDNIVVLGGDDFTEDYGYLVPLAQMLKLKRMAAVGKPVFMIGQTAGPFSSWRRPVFQSLMASATVISARDPITFEYLHSELGLSNAELGADLAFLPLARETDSWDPGITGDYYTVVPSELLWRYSGEPVRERYLSLLTDLALMIGRLYLPSSQLAILPHVLAPAESDDRRASQDLKALLLERGFEPERIVYFPDPLLPFQARQVIGKSCFVVTGRMHAAVSAAVWNVPTVCLSYSRKFLGVIGKTLGMDSLIVDVRGVPWAETKNRCAKAVETAFSDKTILRQHLNTAVRDAQCQALLTIDRLRAALFS